MSGDHRTLNAHGACASVISPTTEMLTPVLAIQSGIAIMTSPKGRPEKKERSETAAVRHEVRARPRLLKVPGLRAAGGSSVGPPAAPSGRREPRRLSAASPTPSTL